MTNFRIILACSGKKADVERAPAGELYKGEIFLKGKYIAEMYQVPYWILSAKYGIIMPTDVIETYDEKLTKPYKGPFPPEPYYGYYIGGQSYFKNFPEGVWRPFVKPGPIGKMLQRLKYMVDNEAECLDHLKSHPNHAAV